MSPSDTRVPLVSGTSMLPIRRRPAILATVLALSALGAAGLEPWSLLSFWSLIPLA